MILLYILKLNLKDPTFTELIIPLHCITIIDFLHSRCVLWSATNQLSPDYIHDNQRKEKRHVSLIYVCTVMNMPICVNIINLTSILHTRMRNNCSALHNYLFHANLIHSPSCLCGYSTENAEHFLMYKLKVDVFSGLINSITWSSTKKMTVGISIICL
jgi:hypothetical protein